MLGLIFDRDTKLAGANGEELGRIEGQRNFERREIEEEREVHLTSQLISEARRLRVPVPPLHWDHEKEEARAPWETGSTTREFFLDPVGYKALRDEIRDEKKARRQGRAHMINWITAWTGLLGAIAAIIGASTAMLALKSKL